MFRLLIFQKKDINMNRIINNSVRRAITQSQQLQSRTIGLKTGSVLLEIEHNLTDPQVQKAFDEACKPSVTPPPTTKVNILKEANSTNISIDLPHSRSFKISCEISSII